MSCKGSKVGGDGACSGVPGGVPGERNGSVHTERAAYVIDCTAINALLDSAVWSATKLLKADEINHITVARGDGGACRKESVKNGYGWSGSRQDPTLQKKLCIIVGLLFTEEGCERRLDD
ncbi:hypothetical protein J6590_085295 [Homalodisca vitripennis]|nr:hypothetical protein J6590_085295 [Homalodisca vitripennis]